ncbi:cytochrome P450 89A2-like [Capsicum annuum]|uniref:Cytochrome P450 n=1 Tax=Capsicum annuum TaxID=4072 RepID=Q1AGW1_CAPAN|nr:cytochrome P450 89A2-like [Capsicum annuum]AAZ52550.1 cytochrome P450 [Capsicum annuum]
METWFIIVVTLCISFFLKSIFDIIISSNSKSKKKLPPGPYTWPVIGTFLWARRGIIDVERILVDLKAKYGPMITLNMGTRTTIFVSSHSLAYQALVQKGSVFSDRESVDSNNETRVINSAPYGSTWRLLRRNLTSEMLHPSRIKSYSKARAWVLDILLKQLRGKQDDSVKLVDHFQYAMFCLLVLMCFGDKLDEPQIKKIENMLVKFLLGLRRFKVLAIFPRLGKLIFGKLWKEFYELGQEQEKTYLPLIEARIKAKEQKTEHGELEDEFVTCYVDTLLNLEWPDEKRKLNHREIVGLCIEFLTAATDTTSTALQWIMANLVKNPTIQDKLYQEIASVVGEKKSESTEEVVKEEDLQKMPYLKAVILEGLRRHPPGHILFPHKVTEEVELNGYVIPKNVTINFMLADMALDPNVWEDPLEFKPERFLVEGSDKESFDITGSREIKMMPFGAGRRICPGYALAMLHLEYFVANLIWHFQWNPVEGYGVDLSEKQEFTVVMKNPLRARICPRVNTL